MNASVEQVAEEMGLKDDLDGIHARHEGGMTYSVVSTRNGSTTYHYVELGSEPSCTCEDFEYNKTGGREVCDHAVKAVMADRLSPEELAMQEMINRTGDFANAAVKAQNAADSLEDSVTVARDASAGAVSTDTQTSNNVAEDGGVSYPEDNTPDAEDVVDDLQEAYDAAVDDMGVQAHAGHVWVQTGKDTPETIPGPGNVSVFDAFLKNADAVEYVHDDHKLADKKPGEWWKNAIRPSKVEEYISEVLGQ